VWLKAYGLPAWGLILLLVLLGTIANTLGDLVDYFIGEGAQYVMSKDDPEVQNRWAQIILRKPKAIPGVIIIFAITPLPDVLLMVPLGMVKYDIKKTVFYMFIGRFIMLFAFALGGVFAIELAYAEGGGEVFGIVFPEWVLGIVFLYLTWLLIAAMAKLASKTEMPVKQEKEIDADL
jgi:membrane protein YqaA with SNARE-associated domain